MQQIFVGIDVSKARLDVACRPHATTHSEPNNADGIAALVARLKALNPALIVLEAPRPSRSSTHARSAISPAPPGDSPRPIASTPRSWPISPRRSAPRSGRCPTPTPESSTPWSRAVVK